MNSNSTTTFLWHDYETFGTVPRSDRPAQFAAIRTNADLEEIGEAINIYCKPANDFLPDPQSCLITHITPQTCLERGIPEHEFAARIERELAATGTIGVGYNTIRFDDEVTRFLFWRNLIDPYAREWQNQCGRWDIMDMVRTCYALRPEGLQWPKNNEGKPSFRLEHLTAANGITHDHAHDALSDVRATIALARLIKTQQPKLFDFCLALHKKDRVAQELGMPFLSQAFLHVSGMFGTERGCLAIMWPLALHPNNKNEVIAWDLSEDPSELTSQDLTTLQTRLFSKRDALPEGMQRLALKSIHINKSPIVISNLKTLTSANAERWNIDLARIEKHLTIAREIGNAGSLNAQFWAALYARKPLGILDVDEDLYGGFVSSADRRVLNELRSLSVEKLAKRDAHFQDDRLAELVFRYRARNFPSNLSAEEAQQWQDHRIARLIEGAHCARNVDAFFGQIDALSENADEAEGAILDALYDYAEMIVPIR